MKCHGRYPIFDPSCIRTYPLATRQNKVRWTDLTHPRDALARDAVSTRSDPR